VVGEERRRVRKKKGITSWAWRAVKELVYGGRKSENRRTGKRIIEKAKESRKRRKEDEKGKFAWITR